MKLHKNFNKIGSKTLIVLLFFIVTSNCQAQNVKLPEGQEISKKSAIKDIHYNTKMYWLVYGEMTDFKCKETILKKYGLQIYQVAGCEVSDKFLEKIKAYNAVINEYMKQAYDKKWKEKLLASDINCATILLDGE